MVMARGRQVGRDATVVRSSGPRHERSLTRSGSGARLPGQALIEFVLRCRLGVGVEATRSGIGHVRQWRTTGRSDGGCLNRVTAYGEIEPVCGTSGCGRACVKSAYEHGQLTEPSSYTAEIASLACRSSFSCVLLMLSPWG